MGGPMMGESGDDQAPAAAVLPIIAMLAQQQQAVMAQESQREDALKDMMKQQLLRVISMIPVANPAGMAARTEPMPPQMPTSGMDDGPEPVGPEQAEDYEM
jgi:hypothetical protein